jgi:hypothetical protein
LSCHPLYLSTLCNTKLSSLLRRSCARDLQLRAAATAKSQAAERRCRRRNAARICDRIPGGDSTLFIGTCTIFDGFLGRCRVARRRHGVDAVCICAYAGLTKRERRRGGAADRICDRGHGGVAACACRSQMQEARRRPASAAQELEGAKSLQSRRPTFRSHRHIQRASHTSVVRLKTGE